MKKKKKFLIRQHVMTGISYMIPIIVCGGILGALAKGFGGFDIGNAVEAGVTPFTNLAPFTWDGFWWSVNQLSSYAMDFAVAVMTAGIAYSIAQRPAIIPALIMGYTATQSKAGFLGGLLMGFVVGHFVNWLKTWKLPRVMAGLMPVMIIPVVATLVSGILFLGVFSMPLSYVMDAFQGWIISLNGGAKSVIGAVIGACMGFDLGGPINKTASLAANAMGADGVFGPMAAKIVGGMTPPIGMFLAYMMARKKYDTVEKETAKAALPMGLCFITEGVIPFAARDPLRVIPCTMAGSAVAGAIAVGMGVESVAGHGGIFVVPMMTKPLWFMIALIVGSLVTGLLYAFWKPTSVEGEVHVEAEYTDDVTIEFT